MMGKKNTCMPIMAQMKNNMAINRQTYGKAYIVIKKKVKKNNFKNMTFMNDTYLE